MSKRKKYSKEKSIQRLLIGSQFGWQSTDPLRPNADIENTWLSHSNPMKRPLLKKQVKQFYGLSESRRLKWMVDIEVEFRDLSGKQYFRGAKLVIQGILRDADGHYQQAIEEIFDEANMRHYVTTHVRAEVIGTNAIEEKDFEEAA